jgi:hypothetical protein
MICSKEHSLVCSTGPSIFLVLSEPPTLQPRVLTTSIMRAYIYYFLLFYLIRGGRDILVDIETGRLGVRNTVGEKGFRADGNWDPPSILYNRYGSALFGLLCSV